ncbi:MAG: hypothetical protein VKK63_00640 [Synechococcus sp.]|jgi:hypothetical protein|nr:hypothetical protein [Synechococcus sp.]
MTIRVASPHAGPKPMMETMLEGWTVSEQAIAREAFDRAYGRAVDKLVVEVRSKSELLDSAETVWQLHDYLSIERHTIEGRFDFRLDGILFIFASLVKDHLLQIQELAGLDAEKLAKIEAMSRF